MSTGDHVSMYRSGLINSGPTLSIPAAQDKQRKQDVRRATNPHRCLRCERHNKWAGEKACAALLPRQQV